LTELLKIFPEDKFNIVASLQKRGNIVGMTGDGVNDAPALHKAEVGISVSNATSIAKLASSAILTKKGLNAILDLVLEGRRVRQRLINYIFCKIAKTFQTSVFVVLCTIIFSSHSFPVQSTQLLIFSVLIDLVHIFIISDNVYYSKKPEEWKVLRLAIVASIVGILEVIESLILISIGINYLDIAACSNLLESCEYNTFCLEILVFFKLFLIIISRVRSFFCTKLPSIGLALAILFAIGATILICTVQIIPDLIAIPIGYTGIVIGFAAGANLFNDVIKVILYKYYFEKYFSKK